MPTQKASSIFLTSLASLFSRFSGLATQIVMAWYLLPADYGLYAIALGITTFTTVMRGGGTGVIFQTMKIEEFKSIGGGLLRAALACGILGTIFTLAMVLPAPYLYPKNDTTGLAWILLWSAVGFVVFNLTTYPRAKMLSQLLFKRLAAMDSASSLVKLASAYYFAANGYGALSFVLSQVLGNLVVLVWSFAAAGMERADFKASPQWLVDTYAMIKIPFFMALITSLGSQTDLFAASFFIPLSALGIYLFTNQMAIQPIQMLSSTLQSVLAPYAARVRGSEQAENDNIAQTFLSGIIFVPIFVMSIAAVYPSVAHLLFQDKWNDSIVPVQCACLFLIYPTLQTLLEAPIIGARRWTLALKLFFGRAVSKIVGALLGVACIKAFSIPSEYIPGALVIAVGLTSSIISFLQIKIIAKEVRILPITFRYEMYSTPAYAILAAIATAGLAKSTVDILGFASTSIRTEALIELLFCIIAYATVSFILLRFGYVESLQKTIDLLPMKFRNVMYKILILNERD